MEKWADLQVNYGLVILRYRLDTAWITADSIRTPSGFALTLNCDIVIFFLTMYHAFLSHRKFNMNGLNLFAYDLQYYSPGN
jgi:hypothetical protein